MGGQWSARESILDLAEDAVLAKGLGATSVEEIAAAAGISRGGFFYHFKDKNELALGLLQRYIDQDRTLSEQIMARAFELTDDPLQACLVGLKMYSEFLEDLPEGHKGCMVATLCYQERLFDRRVRDLMREAVAMWRERYLVLLRQVAEKYPPRGDIPLEELADSFSAMAEGGIVISRALGEPGVLPRQVLVFRNMLRLVFSPG